jgi:catechol 2,3-dioxygenase-like lactoylglutathione lyase family enzyme
MLKDQKYDAIDHVALPVKDIAAAVSWYQQNFSCQVEYQDTTWALIKFENISLALVIPEEHPQHIAFRVDNAERFGPLKVHRDGTRSVYVSDPSGNSVEMMDSSHPSGKGS